MYKRLQGKYEIKWNVKDEYGKQAISEITGIPVEEMDEDDYILVSNEQAREIQEKYQELTEPIEE